MAKRIPILPAALSLVLISAGMAVSHQGATGVVKERMEMMKDIGAAVKALAPMAKGQVAWNADVVRKSAATIASHARALPEKFPEGSAGHPSEASDEIWASWDDFVAEAQLLHKHAVALDAAAAEGPEAARPAFLGIAGSCKSCHEAFRVKH